ncbi:HugZ family pyridoxamine 5'-phosphate oxidase [Acidihalobacter yilgarnensis]|nr:pyridoxamine 5'-phosphate oxidase family protein [Acidihalobacter yilgarnensis]
MSEKGDDPQATLMALHEDCQSLILATLDEAGTPHASPAPYIRDARGDYHVFVSGLSAHTRHLASGRPASVLLIEDEAATAQIFARTRLSQTCRVDEIQPDTAEWTSLLELFELRFGQIIRLLRSLPDFRLFRLQPHNGGRLITGFGRAFDLKDGALHPVGPPNTPEG